VTARCVAANGRLADLYSAEVSKRRRDETGLVLVVPKAGSEVSEHFAHTFRLADHLNEYVRTAVIVERLAGDEPEANPGVEVRVQRHSDTGVLLRMWELLWLATSLRRTGFRTFFVRTSQTAAVPIILLRRILGGRVMYWNCGNIPKNGLRDVGVAAAVKSELPLRVAFRWADTVVTGTNSLADHYSRTYGIPRERLAVLPNEIDLKWFCPASESERLEARADLGLEDDEQVVLSVHRFSPIRRTLLYVPEVLEAVLQQDERVSFVFAGGGPEEEDVRKVVGQRRLDDRVQMLGAVPHKKIRRLYAAADIFMMPSYTEGFPRVLLEAMAMGVPIASTDVGGVREILPTPYHGRLADRDRPLELANAIDELLSDRPTAGELAAEGLRWVRRFEASLVARQLVELARQ
jgi:glycosyltransferase involved in cell wall biosynthesis